MKLRQLPRDTMFVVSHPEESSPIYHMGIDGEVRKVLGSWCGHRTANSTKKENDAFTADMEVQPVFITASHFPDWIFLAEKQDARLEYTGPFLYQF